MKIKISVGERLTLISMLPEKHNYATMKARDEFIRSVGITDEEFKEFEIKQETDEKGQITTTWNLKGNEEKEFEVGEIITNYFKDKLKQLNETEEITPFHTALYEKFVG